MTLHIQQPVIAPRASWGDDGGEPGPGPEPRGWQPSTGGGSGGIEPDPMIEPLRPWLLTAGLAVLAAAWLGPLPGLAARYFTAHMAMHVAVVALAAPLLALALRGSAHDPAFRFPRLFHPLTASAIELVVIWAWHAPALHHLSRHTAWAMALEQTSFLAVALLLWLSAFGGDPRLRAERTAAGIGGLLLTSMHMTLLGVLLALAPRTLYGHADGLLHDQHWGGVLMLTGGGVSYLIGGLWLLMGLLANRTPKSTGVPQ